MDKHVQCFQVQKDQNVGISISSRNYTAQIHHTWAAATEQKVVPWDLVQPATCCTKYRQ